ncbi:MAG: redoxin domain-containing protein [Acidimicrobiia bacterium]|nr:redoxin domain-containing protein [Acidimicrobiia bacterium]
MHLLQLAARHHELAGAGGAVIGIGPAADYQARHLQEKGGIPFPLLLDPDHQVAAAIGLGRQPLYRFVFHLKGWWRWLKSVVRTRQGAITGAYWEAPAVILVDAKARVVWAHRGRFLGDYPPIDDTVGRLQRRLDEQA